MNQMENEIFSVKSEIKLKGKHQQILAERESKQNEPFGPKEQRKMKRRW